METAALQKIDWNSEAYHRLSEPQYEWGRNMLKVLAVRGDEWILDAGCGTGRLTAELAERLPHGHVIAVDASPNMLAKAREFLQPKYGARVTFLQADMSELPMIESVDGIFSSAAIHWVKDHRKLFPQLLHGAEEDGMVDGTMQRRREPGARDAFCVEADGAGTVREVF